jgi:hypothetical protein
MSVNKVLRIIVVLGILMAGLTFFMGAMSATDENINMSGSDYESAYNITKTISIQSMSILNVVMLIVAVAGIIIAVKFMGKV